MRNLASLVIKGRILIRSIRIFSMILTLLAIIALSSCGNDDPGSIGSKKPIRLTVPFEHSELSFRIEYNGDLVTEITLDDGTRFMSFSYDEENRLTAITGISSTFFLYDEGLLIEAREEYEGTIYTTTFSYDSQGRVIQTDEDGWSTTYEYDANGNVSVTQTEVEVKKYFYDQKHNMYLNTTPQFGWPWYGNQFNNPIRIETNWSEESSYQQVRLFEYEYDLEGYPTKVTSWYEGQEDYKNVTTIEYNR